MNFSANEMIFVPDGKVIGASDCIILEEGRVFAAWEEETEGAMVIMGAARDLKGKWEAKRQLTSPDGINRRAPHFNRMADGIMLLYTTGCPCCGLNTEYMLSTDGCMTFGVENNLASSVGDEGALLNGRFLELSDGTILTGGTSVAGDSVAYIFRSEDGGSSWKRIRALRIPENFKAGRENLDGFGLSNSVLWSEGGEYVHALMQSSAGYIFRADSTDSGLSWNNPYPLNVANPNSRMDVVSLPGIQYLACNPSGIPEGKTEGKRSPLNIMQSATNGSNWKRTTVLAGGAGDFSSPAMRYNSGKLYVTYTWNKATIQFVIIEL